ncbi:MAG TPA: hypothetical protein VFL93_06830 [Longimicrobiaceae bacterium]|nr:hypothetical protein [Longimicrobiaceae bacterium]
MRPVAGGYDQPFTGTLDTYDDQRSVAARAEFVKAHHLRGLMFWEYSEDPDEVLLDAMARALR